MYPSRKIRIKSNSAIAIAIYIKDKYAITNAIKLQKLLFFLTLESLQQQNKLLFGESFESWVYGPVVPEVYYYFNYPRFNYSLSSNLNFIQKSVGKEAKKFIDNNIKKYLNFSALELRDWAHEMTPWIVVRAGYDEKERSHRKIKIQELRAFAQSMQFREEDFNSKKDNYE